MKELKFRTLTADEIECRVAQAGKTQKGAWCSLLLYKDARCDQRLLDETVGCFSWKREHQLINGNLFCTVSIKDDSGEWVSKQDVGTESNTEAVKGEASDSFKRACFNWGLGRELYTSPKIFVSLNDGEYSEQQGKVKVSPRVTFRVASIGYDDKRNINALVIVDGNGEARYRMGDAPKQQQKEQQKQQKPTEQPKQQATLFEGDDISLAELFDSTKAYIMAAKTRAELFRINDEYPALQGYMPFKNMLNKRYNELAA